MSIDTSVLSSAVPSICIYGLVLLVITAVALFTKGWTKTTIIILLICWVPWILFSVAVLLLLVSVGGILRVLVATLVIGGPIILMIIIPIILFKFLDRWRN
jgi:hypothetical protein